MSNRRMINKDDCENMRFMKLTIRQRLLYFMLMLYTDDDGIIPLLMVKHKAFPRDKISEKDVLADLKNLQSFRFIELYEGTDGENYVRVCDWWSKQSIRKAYYRETSHPKPESYVERPEDIRTADQQQLSNSSPTVEKESQSRFRKEKISSVHLDEGFQRAGDIYKNLN